ncbi:MAG: pilus assembly PilX N-terminal domain-containing protein [Acidobacteriota bacterium]|nr:MAG: pilus assembly PilX N-terminal domain-containing protein [Acidobacteriota bacterium]
MPSIRNFGHRSSKERGSGLVLAILLVMVMTVLGLGLVFVSEVERDIAIHDQQAKLAREIARSALTHAKFMLVEALVDGEIDNDLKGAPEPGVTVPPKYLCINEDAPSENECRGCLRTTDFMQCKAGEQRMQAVPLYDYYQDVFLFMRPYLEKSEPFFTPTSAPGPTVKGYFSVWIRNNPNDTDPDDPLAASKAGTDLDGDFVLIAEAWVKKHPEPFSDNTNYWFDKWLAGGGDAEVATQGTPENPIVARIVIMEVITQKDPPRLTYSGRNIDLHNTNTIYAAG